MTAFRDIERCPACDGTDRRIVYHASGSLTSGAPLQHPYGAHYQINRCVGCGLLRSSPIFDPESVGNLYREAEEANTAGGEVDNVARTMAGYYRLLRPHLPGRQRLLDVGCDRGLLLQVARADGFQEIHGIEANPTARCEAEALLGVGIADGFYEDAEYPPTHFDAITFIHVLDHVVDPALILRRALLHLRPNGIVLAVVHDVESLLARILGERFPVFNLYHHYFFSRTTLRRLFRHVGYEPLTVCATTNCYSAGYLASRLPGVPPTVAGAVTKALTALGLASMPMRVPLGNIGIAARSPA